MDMIFNYLFYFLASTNKRRTILENRTEERKYSTVVQLDQNCKSRSSVQTNQELVVIQANGELTVDLIDKCQEVSEDPNN